MNTLTRRLLTASAVLCVAGASTFALARGGNCDGMPDGMGQGPRAEQMQGKMAERMKERMAKRQADLKAKLKLTPEQEGAWTQFTTAMQPPAQGPKRPDPAEMAKLTTPQRMEKMQALRSERDATRAALRDALEGVKNVAGAHGVFNMSPADHLGLDQRARVMVQIENGTWKLIK